MNDLFLSYARADDEPFVRWLYEQLRSDGLTIWFDRESMPSRSLTFLHEIRTAIEEASRVLVVVGPAALASDYVRAEWQHAQAAGKVVTPVLRTGTADDLPPEFRNLHAVDFRAERDGGRAVRELRRVLSDPLPELGTVHGDVPALAPHFRPRPDQLSQIADALLVDLAEPVTITGPDAFVVLHGMGGIGKSVLAAAFARSTAARRSFPDGLFWVGVGASAGVGTVASRLSRVLPGVAAPETIAGGAAEAIRAQLAGKRALIVLDDVERVEQLEPVSGAADVNTRFLVTTRNADVAVGSGGRSVRLGELTADAAAGLLADWLRTAPDRLPAEAAELVGECGGHPLALALNGAIVQRDGSWRVVIDALRAQELDHAEIRLAHYPYRTVQRALQVSLDALTRFDRDAAARFRELAALNWPEGVPEAAVIRLWGHRGGLSARQATKLISELGQRALLRTQGDAPDRTVRIHDLQLAHLRRPPTDVETLNRGVLAAYAAACEGDWPRGPADGYFHRNLVAHLLTGGLRDDVHRLLWQEHDGRNAWYRATSDLGLVDRWLDDIDTAAGLLTEQDEPDQPRRVGLRVRYALMKASVQSQASAMPSVLLELCARHGVITLAKALSFARAAALDEERVDALSGLLLLADADLRPGLEAEALGIALSVAEPSRRIWALDRLVPALSPATASQALAFVRSVPDDDGRVALLPALVAVVPTDEIPEIADIARGQQNALLATETLAAIARRVADPSAVLDEATRRADAVDEWGRVRALCAVADAADPPRRADLMDSALARIAASDSSNDVAWSLAAVARFLTGAQLERALELVELTASDEHRVQAIFALVPYLPRKRRHQLVSELVEQHSHTQRAHLWGAQYITILASDLPAARRTTIVPGELAYLVRMATLPSAIATRPMRPRDWDYDAALEVLGTRLPDRYVLAAAQRVAQLPDAEDRAEILGRLVPRLPEADVVPLLSAEYQRVLAIVDTTELARTLAACSAHVLAGERSETAEESLRWAARSERPTDPERIVATVAGQLPPDRAAGLVANELERIAAIDDVRRRDTALATLAPVLTPADLPRALDLARSTVPGHRYGALAKLAAGLTGPDRATAIDEVLKAASGWVAEELPDDFSRALAHTVEWMSQQQVDVAFTIARSVHASAPYADMLHHLAPRLSPLQLRAARDRAERIDDAGDRVSALAAIANSGSVAVRTQRALTRTMLELSYSIADGAQRARALVQASVADADRPRVLRDVFAAATDVVEDDRRARLLCDLLAVLPAGLAPTAFDAVLTASLGRRRSGSYGGYSYYEGLGRPFLLSMLERAAPWLGARHGPLLVSHVARSMRTVARWWP